MEPLAEGRHGKAAYVASRWSNARGVPGAGMTTILYNLKRLALGFVLGAMTVAVAFVALDDEPR